MTALPISKWPCARQSYVNTVSLINKRPCAKLSFVNKISPTNNYTSSIFFINSFFFN